MVTSFSQFTPIKVKKIVRKSQPHSREKLRKLRLRQKSDFHIKRRVEKPVKIHFKYLMTNEKRTMKYKNAM